MLSIKRSGNSLRYTLNIRKNCRALVIKLETNLKPLLYGAFNK